MEPFEVMAAKLTKSTVDMWSKTVLMQMASDTGVRYDRRTGTVRGQFDKIEKFRRNLVNGPTIELVQKKLHNSTTSKQRRYFCARCSYRTGLIGQLIYHRRLHQFGRPIYRCDRCTFSSFSKSYLSNHTIKVHSKDPPSFLCSKCPKKFLNRRSMINHLRLKHTLIEAIVVQKVMSKCDRLRNSCNLCTRSFTRFTLLANHVQRVHKKWEKRVENATNEKMGKMALARDGKEGNFICSKCSKIFGRLTHLLEHQDSHTQGRSHCCPMCYRFFQSKASLRNHRRLLHNSNARKHLCDTCSVSFCTSTDLKRHQGSKKHRAFSMFESETVVDEK